MTPKELVGVVALLVVASVGTAKLVALPGPKPPVPLEVIDPRAKTYTIRIENPFPDYHHVKDPVLGHRGQLTFQFNGKEIVIGPSIKWVATEE
jgi:hypothetical protein